MLMSTDVASIMLPVSRALIDRDRELDTMAGVHANPSGAPGAVRGMKRGDPEPDGQTAAALVDSTGAECKRPRIDGSGGISEIGQVRTIGYSYFKNSKTVLFKMFIQVMVVVGAAGEGPACTLLLPLPAGREIPPRFTATHALS